MTFRLTKFSDVACLPTGMPKTPVGTAPTPDTVIETAGGGFFDTGESQVDAQLPYDLPLSGILLDDDDLESGGLTFGEKLTWLRVNRGLRGQLERTNADDSTEWCWARLMRAPAERSPRNQAHQEVEILFQVLSLWYGTAHDDPYQLAEAVTVCYVATAGTAEAREIVLTVTPASTPITGIKFACADTEFQWAGTLSSGQSLEIDCGAQTVRIAEWPADDADAYSGFDLLSGQAQNDWLRFPAAGFLYLTVTKTGGSAADELRIAWTDVSE